MFSFTNNELEIFDTPRGFASERTDAGKSR